MQLLCQKRHANKDDCSFSPAVDEHKKKWKTKLVEIRYHFTDLI